MRIFRLIKIKRTLAYFFCALANGFMLQANAVEEPSVIENGDLKGQEAKTEDLKTQGFKKFKDLPEFNAADSFIVSKPPLQKEVSTSDAIYKNGYQLFIRDYFEVQGRVLSRRIYLGDERADISPIDVALGWGKMSDVSFLQQVEFRQNNRFLYWHVNEFPMPRKELEASASNMHLIPEDSRVEHLLKSIKKGQIVTLYGYLVDVKAPDDFIWTTSRSRDDSGDGACEIIYVKEVKIRN